MKRIETPLSGLVLIEPDVYGDERGWFMETWNAQRYQEIGLDLAFVQDNLSFSYHGALRGLHYQNPHPQGKLVSVLEGEVFDVAVDLRKDSPTFARWYSVTLSAENRLQLYVPEGFAHGFVVTGRTALFHYKCTTFYNREAERALRWDDPEIGIAWPVEKPVLSPKDAAAPFLSAAPPEHLFTRVGG